VTRYNRAMQLSRESSPANLIRAFDAGRIRVGERWISGNLIVAADRIVEPWIVQSPQHLTVADLEPAVAMRPAIVLLGTGAEVLLPDVDLMAALAARAIGLEIMSTPAACRTYNVLVHEQRRVVAALFNFAV
jgi:uncharacterized protein